MAILQTVATVLHAAVAPLILCLSGTLAVHNKGMLRHDCVVMTSEDTMHHVYTDLGLGRNVCIFDNDICPTISASGVSLSVITYVF